MFQTVSIKQIKTSSIISSYICWMFYDHLSAHLLLSFKTSSFKSPNETKIIESLLQ